jgi:SAM-dependent methyltransferase
MKLHLGCGMTLLEGFVNIDNSPTVLLAKMPYAIPAILRKISLVNQYQLEFLKTLQGSHFNLRYANVLKLPFNDNSVDFCYSSHMLGWCLSYGQLNRFAREVYRVLKPGGAGRLSFFDFDKLLDTYRQHRSTMQLMERMPLGIREFTWRQKLKFLFSPNMNNGIPLNAETLTPILEAAGFVNIRVVGAGETGLETAMVEGVDLAERPNESVYMECRKKSES